EAERAAVSLDQVHRRHAQKASDEFVGRVVVDFGRRADLPQLAAVNHRDAVAHSHGFDLVVGDVDRGGAHGLLELLELAAGAGAQLGVKVRQRLIQQKDRWIADQRTRERDALPLAARKLTRSTLREVIYAEQAGCPLDLALNLVALRPLSLQWESDVVPNRQVRIEPVVLKHHGDAPRAWRDIIDHLATDQDYTGRR